MSNSGSSSLRPAWKGGRGFQPPPTVTSDTRARSSSISDSKASNKFSALQDDDDFQLVGSSKNKSSRDRSNSQSEHNHNPTTNSRGEAFRSSFQGHRSSSKRGEGGGRSLADLAKRVPHEGPSRVQSTGGGPYAGERPDPRSRRYSDMGPPPRGGGPSGDPQLDAAAAAREQGPSEYKKAVDAAKVIRYTREKLLALRPRQAASNTELPPHLKHVEASTLLAEEPQDPVCWDTLDADEIWATVPTRRTSMPGGMPKGGVRGGPPPGVGGQEGEINPEGSRRRSYAAPTGRWQRGQALPPADERSKKDKDNANSPDDLWDDPIGGALAGAAMDFSAFGGMPEEGIARATGGSSVGSADAFDFEKMAEQTRKFEEELHGPKGGGSSNHSNAAAEEEEDNGAHHRTVDPKRPLAAAGMAIRSGSGDDVNVFEDFDDPGEGEEPAEAEAGKQPATTAPPAIKGANEDPSASSRLMAMIGVKKDEGAPPADGGWNGSSAHSSDNATAGLLGLGAASASTTIPLNPWGDPILPTPSAPAPQQNMGLGMDLASRLESFAAEQKAREAAEMEQKELLRRRQEQEDQQRRAQLAQQQERARQQQQFNPQPQFNQQQQQQQQQPNSQNQQQTPQSQVEIVLMERITTILENSWGRSDLMSILSTLHSEDSRVIPLLSNVDLLRDLIAHNPRRVALRQDPAFGTEMAVLQMTNQQFQQHQAQVRAQEEEIERRRQEEQLRMETLQRQRSLSNDGPPRVNPEAPWFYSDPQGNIQGPFRGDEMRQWLEAGYFKGDLPISQQAGGPFTPLSVIFPEIGVAFQIQQPDTRAQEEAEARARAEEERMMEERRMEERRLEEQRLEQLRLEEERTLQERRRAEEEYERQRHAEEQARKEQEARVAAERERLEREAAEAAAQAAAADNGGNQSSAQLKMMLGLPAQQQAAEEAEAKPAEKGASKVDNKNNQKRSTEPSPAPQAPPPAAKPAAPAWGGAATQTTTTRKSMSEIQREEARRAAALATQQGNQPRQPSSGWANVAAARSTAWTAGTVKPTSAAAVVAGGAPVAVAAGNRVGAQPAAARPKAAAGTVMRKTSASQPAAGATSSAQEFGASMSPALEAWCKDQMKQLNGTDDLTLVSFCMSLNDAAEIRQYLTTYLGSTPQVNSFATEFIAKMGLGPAKQEEWETPGSAKKGRKKKGGATR